MTSASTPRLQWIELALYAAVLRSDFASLGSTTLGIVSNKYYFNEPDTQQLLPIRIVGEERFRSKDLGNLIDAYKFTAARRAR